MKLAELSMREGVMVIFRSIVCVLVALSLWPAAVLGQSPELVDAHDRMEFLYAQARH